MVDSLTPDLASLLKRLQFGSDGKVDFDPDNKVIREILGCKSNSFPAGTMVLLANGALRPIQLVGVGERVASYDTVAGVSGVGVVIDAWSAPYRGDFVTVETDGGGGFSSTADHQVWQPSSEQWAHARDLTPGVDHAHTPEGQTAILEVRGRPVGVTVWDLTVTPAHTFYVTNQPNAPPILVHNADCSIREILDGDGEVVSLEELDVDTGLIRRLDADGTILEVRPDGTWEATLPDGSLRRSTDLPKSWQKYDRSKDLDFLRRLEEFGGGLDPSTNFRGGEGQLFFSNDRPNVALKRWFESRADDFSKSVDRLEQARREVHKKPDLAQVLDVVEVHERGPDWILRDFDPRSMTLSEALKDPNKGAAVKAAKNQALSALQGSTDPELKEVLRKLSRDSANLHWSSDGKILVIDMQ